MISVTRVIQAPAERVWDCLVDTTRWPDWGPSVSAVDCSDRHVKAGSTGRVRTLVGLWLPFAITQFEESRFWSWRIAGIPATGHRVTPIDVDSCQLSFEVPRLAAPYARVCAIALRRIERICITA
jgi:hypothetical protein